ncbi:hypothetical protein HPP92_021657 [Vanilla planifolia]|uniref:Uncharacterized protein n=1 Tax=Vanilla planifolia TaxID=51239 RepID=A0A835UI64_VANPL|nr:hypothetical protein HPP92_021977 [Vanilla planifolia]KAG0463181.1 hypothetical protein HPP92_021657 [Vanilla planifolia]
MSGETKSLLGRCQISKIALNGLPVWIRSEPHRARSLDVVAVRRGDSQSPPSCSTIRQRPISIALSRPSSHRVSSMTFRRA